MEYDVDETDRIFHNNVRDIVIFVLLFCFLWILSVIIINAYHKTKEEISMNEYDEKIIYGIAKFLCYCSLTVSLGAALLLPISIVSNEVLLLYPNSYYIQWLNSSLIFKLWGLIFFFHNLCLFILLPFAYLLTESEGLPGSRRGLAARFYETIVVLILLGVLTVGLSYTLSTFFDFEIDFSSTFFPIPFLYSCISLIGAMMLLLCTPFGFVCLFSVAEELIMKPKFLQDIQGEFYAVKFEEEQLLKKLSLSKEDSNEALLSKLGEVGKQRQELDRQRHLSPLRRTLGFPFVIVALLVLTSLSVLMVARNTLELLVGVKHLPFGSTQTFQLGINSLSVLGSFGASLEIVLILYLWIASIVGFYTLPYFNKLRPYLRGTVMTHLLGNCAVLLVLTSALPLLARTLGITNFDLLSHYGHIEWLGNYYLVLMYNAVFAVATAICIFTKFTGRMRQELLRCFQAFYWPSAQQHHWE